MTSNGIRPPETADKSLAEIVGDISNQASAIVREEVELAKAELQVKAARLARGAAAGAAAGVFALVAVFFLLQALAWGIASLFNVDPGVWIGFAITAAILLIAAGAAGAVAFRFVKRATPPVPELAIEEAKRTRAALEQARH
ncbi:MAG: phage holin family protein [Actinomycetota bacterium]|nr:phage holin family protein [Actinomycetota bacterium]